jgi:hypothetical protein
MRSRIASAKSDRHRLFGDAPRLSRHGGPCGKEFVKASRPRLHCIMPTRSKLRWRWRFPPFRRSATGDGKKGQSVDRGDRRRKRSVAEALFDRIGSNRLASYCITGVPPQELPKADSRSGASSPKRMIQSGNCHVLLTQGDVQLYSSSYLRQFRVSRDQAPLSLGS